MYYALRMQKRNLLVAAFMALPWLTACSIDTSMELEQQQLAADIYAQLALGYMASGHLDLAELRLHKALELMPNGNLTLRAAQEWHAMHLAQP
jgi:Tfp pilus assembly protein PilF